MGGWLRPKLRPWVSVVFFSALIALLSSQSALSEHAARPSGTGTPMPNKPELGTAGERLNANTIAIISGNHNATYLTIAYDLSAVLDNGDEFRVLPVVGKGGGQNIKDVRYLKGIDLGITQSNLLNSLKRSNEIGKIDDKIVYIAKLFNEEMHLVVRADRLQKNRLRSLVANESKDDAQVMPRAAGATVFQFSLQFMRS